MGLRRIHHLEKWYWEAVKEELEWEDEVEKEVKESEFTHAPAQAAVPESAAD